MILAVDVGYGYTKYAYGGILGRFPSAVANVPVLTGVGESSVYRFNGSYYLVGEEAGWSDVIPTRTEDFLVNYSPLLIYHLFKKEHIGSVSTLCVSLSISEFDSKKERLASVCRSFAVNGEAFTQNVRVYPQGLGIWVSSGSPNNALIVDIGFNTLDVLTMIDGQPRPEYSFSFSNRGAGVVADAVNGLINAKFPGSFLTPFMADSIIANGGKFKFFRREYDFSDFIGRQKKIFAEGVLSAVLSESRLKDILSYIDEFIIAGGGAYFIPLETADRYGFTIPENPEFANVKGFLLAAEGENTVPEDGEGGV